MFNNISHSGIYVLDQDEAIDFYAGKLGLEVSGDVDLGFMRWLTVCVPGNPDHHILLQKPGPPMMAEEVAAQIRDLVTKGAMGLSLILTIDCGFRDPFGNQGRITQPAAQMGEISDEVKQRWAEGK
jgi:catechol 2,3-dioxygenase-like lactoylglutathione lyase family enzyme